MAHHTELEYPLVKKPISLQEAKWFIEDNHRHFPGMNGWKFGTSITYNGKRVGVATCGRPVARKLDDGLTLEISRVCTLNTPNACSMLYAALINAGRQLGYCRFVTYILAEESGTSLKAITNLGLLPDKQVIGKFWTGFLTTGPRAPIEGNNLAGNKIRYMAVYPGHPSYK